MNARGEVFRAAALFVAFCALIALTIVVVRGGTTAFDTGLLGAMYAAGPNWVTQAVRIATKLGGGFVLVTIAGVAALLLYLAGRKSFAAWLVFAGIGGSVLSNGLKHVIGRARPDVAQHLVEVSSPSFPSSHALNSAVIYLTLAAILSCAPVLAHRRALIWSVAVTIVAVVGLSRIYLGVHYPTDVIGGWLIGGLWAFVFREVVTRQKMRW